MSSSSRCRPFVLTFQPSGQDEAYKPRVIPVNSPPVEVENQHFKGCVCLVHDTGNEPVSVAKGEPDGERRGVELQIQGVFKHQVSQGEQTTSGIWVGGELQETLKLGWIMQNVVQLCMKYARKKTEGRLHFTLGGKTESPQLSFPIGQLFTVIPTPAGEQPPKLGTPEMAGLKWPGNMTIHIEQGMTYTMVYRTPYMDLCSWELLKVPGVSPLPIESILGDLSSARVMMYDVAAVGNHAEWRQGALLEWEFRRGGEGDSWVDESRNEPLEPTGAKTPLDDNSEASEASEVEDDEDDIVAVDDQEEGSDSSETSDDSQDDEEEDAMSRAESQALFEIEGWRPRSVTSQEAEQMSVRVPYYIEAIDRRRKRKVRYWYVFAMTNPDGSDDWWHAKAATELASLCRPKRRLRTFRRGPGARRYTCCAVKTLEQFRGVVNQHLNAETRLRNVIVAATIMNQSVHGDRSETLSPEQKQEDAAEETPAQQRRVVSGRPSGASLGAKGLSPANLANKVAAKRRARRGPLLPPNFFQHTHNICGLAFAHARPGRTDAVREALVGAIHFEGRLCEELMRLSVDGTLRCFTPYDCEKPRVLLTASEILHVQRIPGLFLGRFYLWQVQSILRVFVFCCADEKECDEWIDAIRNSATGKADSEYDFLKRVNSIKSFGSVPKESDSKEQPSVKDCTPTTSNTDGPAAQPEGRGPSRNYSHVTSMMASMARMHATIQSVTLLRNLREPGLSDVAALLVDSTRARRWRQSRRLVLNDRVLVTSEQDFRPTPASMQAMLESVLRLSDRPVMSEFIAFVNATCTLKAARMAYWSQSELMSFWLNLYHCLLLHGWLVLGRPVTKQENQRFHSRVSYVVGSRPVSLREVERVILRVLKGDNQGVARAHASGVARQLLGFCSLCRRRRKPVDQARVQQPGSDDARRPDSPKGGDVVLDAGDSDKAVALHCLPRVQLPRVGWRFHEQHPCLFLGEEPEGLCSPKQDLRVTLCLNRGDVSCPPTIPVFTAENVEQEMNEVAAAYVLQYVTVEERDGRIAMVTLPSCCLGLKQELGVESEAVLKFIWPFMQEYEERGLVPTKSTKLKFSKPAEEPRHPSEFSRFATSTPVKEPHGPPQRAVKVGIELDPTGGTGDLLEKLAGPRPRWSEVSGQMSPQDLVCKSEQQLQQRDVILDVDTEDEQQRKLYLVGTPMDATLTL